MKMNLKEVNYKEFFLEKGEKIGLWVAGGLAVLLFLFGAVWKGVFSESASANVKTVQGLTTDVEGKIANSRPDENLGLLDQALVKATNPPPIDPVSYACKNPTFVSTIAEDTKWRKPEVAMPTEFMVETIRQLLPSYALSEDAETVIVLVPPENTKMSAEETARLQRLLKTKGRGKRPPMAPGGNTGAAAAPQRPTPGQPGGGMGAGPTLGSGQLSKDNEKEKELVTKVIRVEELNEKSKFKIMELPVPAKMVVITGEFPFRAQMEEFRRALRFASVEQMLASQDVVCEFLGIEVERRIVGKEAWEPLDYVTPMKKILVRAVERERDDPQLVGNSYYPKITFLTRLLKARPKLARDQKYADVSELPGIKDTLEAFKLGKVKTTAVEAKGSKFNEKDVDIDADPDDKGKGGNRPSGGGALPGKVDDESTPRDKPGAAPGEDTQGEGVLPEKCLVRFIDPTVIPGRTYEYRVRIVMSNPNYDRTDKAVTASLTLDKEIKSEWKVIGKKVAFPPVQHVYAVDETSPTSRRLAANADRVPMQIHRWIETTRLDPDSAKTEVNVGDWSILERVLAYRGDYIGRREEVDLPVWNPFRDKFLLAQPIKKSGRRMPKGIGIDFTTDAVLVDFEGGLATQTFSIGGKTVTDNDVPAEVLISENDGKLTVVRNSVADYDNPERKKRLETWQKWIKQVKDDTEGSSEKKKNDGLFNK